MDYISTYETQLRLGFFVGAIILFTLLEAILPRKTRSQKRLIRWVTNFLMVGIYTLILRLIFPIFAVGVAAYAAQKGWGVLNRISAPNWLEIIVAIILLDMLVYWQHRLFHIVPFFWAFHKVHHADRDLDASSGVRFHPIEIIISMLYKLGCVIFLGPAVLAVIIFEILLNASALFNHANLRLPAAVDLWLRKLIITPDFHRVHHSVIITESNRNFGFFFSVWDYIFRSYQAQPKAGHENMVIGLKEAQTQKPNSLLWSLAFPFKKSP